MSDVNMKSSNQKNLVTISGMASDDDLLALANRFFVKSCEYKYSNNFTRLGRPIIRFPHDILHKLQLELMLRML